MNEFSLKQPNERSVFVMDDELPVEFSHDSVVQAFAALTPGQFAAMLANRVFIERAKGLLMAIYSTDAEHAFDMLRQRSQETNVKLRSLARQLVQEFPALADTQRLPTPDGYDKVLSSVHERM
jgi:hypothetical protein